MNLFNIGMYISFVSELTTIKPHDLGLLIG